MAPRARTPVARRRLTERAAARPAMQYRQTRAAIALFLFILAFGFIWLVNGEFTAEFVMVITGRTATVGWSAHLVITAIEIAPALLAPFVVGLPRRIIALLWLFSLPFGVFDVLSSAVGVAPWLSWTGAAGVPAHIQNTFAAEIIGFLPERMIMWLLLVARNVLRGER